MAQIKSSTNITIFAICFLLTVFIQNQREHLQDSHDLINAIAGSAPSFLYVFGALVLIIAVKPDFSLKEYIKAASMFTVGACFYEISQIWTERQFDFLDLLATLLAYWCVVFVYAPKSAYECQVLNFKVDAKENNKG